MDGSGFTGSAVPDLDNDFIRDEDVIEKDIHDLFTHSAVSYLDSEFPSWRSSLSLNKKERQLQLLNYSGEVNRSGRYFEQSNPLRVADLNYSTGKMFAWLEHHMSIRACAIFLHFHRFKHIFQIFCDDKDFFWSVINDFIQVNSPILVDFHIYGYYYDLDPQSLGRDVERENNETLVQRYNEIRQPYVNVIEIEKRTCRRVEKINGCMYKNLIF